ncbi:LysM domain-containing protein [Colletotrichum caudatum]|nr:LysM domain-containing protein [Colletotrichum caudatum]
MSSLSRPPKTRVASCPLCTTDLTRSPRVDLLDADGIEEICTKSCRNSLSDLRTKIRNDCDPKKDVFDHNLVLYPGNACDHVLGEWRNDTDLTPSECDDCILGPMQLEVNSPIGHTEARADEFKTDISSCSVKGYAYTSPPPYASSQTSTSPESPTIVPQDWSAQRMSSECATTYRVQEGDTCDSIAAAQEVPSRSLTEANDELDGWCGGLEAGQDLCLPARCKVHPLKPEDSCESLLEAYGATQKSLAKWNPKLYIQCDTLNVTTGYICLG